MGFVKEGRCFTGGTPEEGSTVPVGLDPLFEQRHNRFIVSCSRMRCHLSGTRHSKQPFDRLAGVEKCGRSWASCQAIADSNLKSWILQQQQADQDRWKIDSTPSFVINGQKYSGEMSYDAFRKLIPEV